MSIISFIVNFIFWGCIILFSLKVVYSEIRWLIRNHDSYISSISAICRVIFCLILIFISIKGIILL
jgi:hypothetical protein